jgi:hypothetical protein
MERGWDGGWEKGLRSFEIRVGLGEGSEEKAGGCGWVSIHVNFVNRSWEYGESPVGKVGGLKERGLLVDKSSTIYIP